MPVSTQENKHRIGSDWTFFHLVLSTPPDQNKLKMLQVFIIRVADHRIKLEQKIGTESPCAGSIFVLIQSDPECAMRKLKRFACSFYIHINFLRFPELLKGFSGFARGVKTLEFAVGRD